MTTTNPQSRTTIDEIAEDIYRISTPVVIPGGGFTFNQYLLIDDEPLIFHTGPAQAVSARTRGGRQRAAARALAPHRLLARRGG